MKYTDFVCVYAFLLCICRFSSISRAVPAENVIIIDGFLLFYALEYIVCTSTVRVKLLIYFMCG